VETFTTALGLDPAIGRLDRTLSDAEIGYLVGVRDGREQAMADCANDPCLFFAWAADNSC
jgi:hypothetical protein